MNNYRTKWIKIILDMEERNAVWLSKKLFCSHTLVYNWIKGKSEVSDSYWFKIKSLFADRYEL